MMHYQEQFLSNFYFMYCFPLLLLRMQYELLVSALNVDSHFLFHNAYGHWLEYDLVVHDF